MYAALFLKMMMVMLNKKDICDTTMADVVTMRIKMVLVFLVLMLSRCCGSVATTPMMKTVTDDNVHDKSKVEDNGWLAN